MKFLSQINVNTEYTLPIVDGTNGQVLSTDGSGVAYWGTISAGSLTLDGLSDVIITSPSSDQMLRYGLRQGDTVPVWHNFTPNFLTPSSSINALGDVTITTAAAGQILQYNGTAWINTILSTVEYVSKVQHIVKAGVAIAKGRAIYVTGSNGTNMIVGLASNASEGTSSKTMGLAASTAAINDNIFVVTEGLLAGLDTSTATAGDPVWLGTNGNLIFGLLNKPVAPAHLVYLGVVTRVQSNNGEIFVHVQNGFELHEIHDVLISSPSTGQLLQRASDGLWKNWTPNFLTAHPGILAASSVNNSNGTVIQDITLETNGHVTGLASVNLDTRYYTESEIDSFFGGESEIAGYNQSNWDTAYGWGDHAAAGYLTSLPAHTHTIANVTGLQTALDGKLSSDSDSEQDVGGRYFRFNNGINRINIDPRWNESGYDADLGVFHMYSTTAGGVQWGRTGIALYSGSAYQYLTTKSGTTGIFLNNQEIIHSGNIANQTVATAGGLTSMNISQFSNNSGYIAVGSTVPEVAAQSSATRFKSIGDISQGAGNHALQVFADVNNDAFMAFHISNDYAIHFGLDNTSNRLFVGGWSDGTGNKYQMWDSRDFSSTNITNWNTAYGWGDHAAANYASEDFVTSQGYITGYTETDTLATVTGRGASTTSLITTTNGFQGRFYRINEASGNRGGLYPFNLVSGTGTDYSLGIFSEAEIFLAPGGNAIKRFTMSSSGAATFTSDLTIGGSLTENSSIRYKKDVVGIESTTDRVELLKPVRYKKIENEVEEIGLIAEDVAQLFPEVVKYDDEGRPDGVNYSRLSVILLKAVQELTERVNKLENK